MGILKLSVEPGWHVSAGDRDVKVLNEVLPGQGMVEKPETAGSFFLAAYEAEHSKGVKVSVTRDSGANSGSGFYVLDGTYVVTNAHVVNNTRTIDVRSDDGQTRKAHFVKLDDTGDLALLKVEGLRADPARAVDIDNLSSVYQDDIMASLGVPGTDNLKQFLAPMRAKASVSVGEIFDKLHAYQSQPGERATIGQVVAGATRSNDPDLRQDAQDYLASPRTVYEGQHLPGMSGGHTVGADGKFAGVNDMVFGDRFNSNSGAVIPGYRVGELISTPGKFNFNYDRVSNFNLHPTQVVAEHSLATAAALVPKLNRFAPAAVGAYRGYLGIEDLKGYLNNDNSAELKSQYGNKFVSDMGSAGGGLALSLSLMERAPGKVRVAGMLIGGAAYLASEAYRTYSDFRKDTPYLKDVKRKDGSSREPFLWRYGS